jgi:hypothetical protein
MLWVIEFREGRRCAWRACEYQLTLKDAREEAKRFREGYRDEKVEFRIVKYVAQKVVKG